MARAIKSSKRPCRICRRWFLPNPRLKDRQKTCGDVECKKEWHRKQCKAWNKKHSDYFRANYLQKKLDSVSVSGISPKSSTHKPPLKSKLPLDVVQEVIGIQHIVIIEYFGQLLFRRFQEVIKSQVVVNTVNLGRLPCLGISRCDRL